MALITSDKDLIFECAGGDGFCNWKKGNRTGQIVWGLPEEERIRLFAQVTAHPRCRLPVGKSWTPAARVGARR